MPALADPLTGHGKFDWKGETIDFSFELTSPVDLREKRPAKLLLSLDTQAIAARFDGTVRVISAEDGKAVSTFVAAPGYGKKD